MEDGLRELCSLDRSAIKRRMEYNLDASDGRA